jgi:hypothetical protein
VEFQNTRTTLTSFGIHEIFQKRGHGVEWVNRIYTWAGNYQVTSHPMAKPVGQISP